MSLLDFAGPSRRLGKRLGIEGYRLVAFLHTDPAQFESHSKMIRLVEDAHYYRHAIEKPGREVRTGGQVDLKMCYLTHPRQDFRCTRMNESGEDARPAHVASCSGQSNEPRMRRRDLAGQNQ